MIPDKCIILICGIPAVGKNEFCCFLVKQHGFIHYDLEFHPAGWPHPELKEYWERSRNEFVNKLKSIHDRIVLNWGFPVGCIDWVRELRDAGCPIIWFSGDVDRARESFLKRRSGLVEVFDEQVRSIKAAGLPERYGWKTVETLPANGIFMDTKDIEKVIFN